MRRSAVVGSEFAGRDAEWRMRMTTGRTFRLGYNTLTWGATPDMEEMLGAISGAGWEGVEFISSSLDWLGTPSRLRGLVDRYGLEPVSVFGNVSVDSDAEEVMERQRRRMEFAAELGATVYPFLGGKRAAQRYPSDEDFKRLAEQCNILMEYAGGLGLTVAYHAHPLCTVETEEEQDRLLEFAPDLPLCLDVSVSARMGEDPVPQIVKYRDRLAYLHMKDDGVGKFCVMGQGVAGLDFGKIRETLNSIGYSGWVMGELSNYADTPAVESCYANMDHLKSVGY